MSETNLTDEYEQDKDGKIIQSPISEPWQVKAWERAIYYIQNYEYKGETANIIYLKLQQIEKELKNEYQY